MLLHRVESAFVTGGNPTYDDLAISVFICANKYADALAAFDDKSLGKFMRKWHDKLSGKRFWRKPRVIDLESKSDAFSEYIRQGSKVPYYAFNEKDIGDSNTEPVQSVKIALLSKTSLTESEILDRPWGLCLWDYVTLQAMEGKLRMFDEAGRNAIKDAQEFANRLAANLEKQNNGTP